MTDELTSPSVKSGNVLALLNTLYTSGFAMASSSTPLLKGKTLHTLYALSFVVYVMNSVCSWLHVSFVVKGYITSFPLNTWIVVSLVVTAVTGSMLTWLLFVLCIENAFAHRLDITPYRSGCALVFEAFVEWTQAFNNFRISFLIMSLHDAPMTIFNFFYIAACRCPNPRILSWPLVLSASSCTVSLIWRLTVLYFSYKRMVCSKPVPQKKSLTGVAVNTPLDKHFQMAIDTSSASNGGRLGEFDETWPIRWARFKTLGPHPDVIVEAEVDGNIKFKPKIKPKPRFKETSTWRKWMRKFENCRANFDIVSAVRNYVGYTCWFILSFITYIGCSFVLFVPCLYHYTCRHNSFYHRHKLCRSFIRYFSITFHYAIFYLSLLFSIVLIGLNLTMLSSVHGLGTNTLPPEIDRICVTVSPKSKIIYLNILPASAFDKAVVLWQRLNKKYAANDTEVVTECKPLWEDGRLGMGVSRRNTGPWQMRTPLMENGNMLAVSTFITFNNTDQQSPSLQLEYTYTLFIRTVYFTDVRFTCTRDTEWKIVPSVEQLSWPYFSACEQNWKFSENPELIKCSPTRHKTKKL